MISKNKKILIAPLNWGLGHAARCIPVINNLLNHGFQPVIAGDGDSLELLKKEFPQLKSYELPSYDIRYSKKGRYLKFKLLLNTPNILKVIKKEQQVVGEIIKKENIKGIISDNRFGVYSNKVPSVYITHQINVLSGITTFFTSNFHQKIIAKYDECWVPDFKGKNSLAGKLSQTENTNLNLKYIGPLSRFTPFNPLKEGIIKAEKKYHLLVLLSGPEPQRTLLEEKLLNELKDYPKKVLFIRGIISDKKESLPEYSDKNIEIVNYLLQKELKKAIAESDIIISRSGYSTIMDLSALQAKSFFIPTSGQEEQKYLAEYLEKKNIAPFSDQDSFTLKKLDKLNRYTGFIKQDNPGLKRNYILQLFKQ